MATGGLFWYLRIPKKKSSDPDVLAQQKLHVRVLDGSSGSKEIGGRYPNRTANPPTKTQKIAKMLVRSAEPPT